MNVIELMNKYTEEIAAICGVTNESTKLKLYKKLCSMVNYHTVAHEIDYSALHSARAENFTSIIEDDLRKQVGYEAAKLDMRIRTERKPSDYTHTNIVKVATLITLKTKEGT